MNRLEKLIRQQIRDDSGKSLWRQTSGNREKAMGLIRKLLTRYKNVDFSDFELAFDCACADVMEGGCEVEWES